MTYDTASVNPHREIPTRRVSPRLAPSKAACLRKIPADMPDSMRRSAIRGVITTYDRRGGFAAMSQAQQINDAFYHLDEINRSLS